MSANNSAFLSTGWVPGNTGSFPSGEDERGRKRPRGGDNSMRGSSAPPNSQWPADGNWIDPFGTNFSMTGTDFSMGGPGGIPNSMPPALAIRQPPLSQQNAAAQDTQFTMNRLNPGQLNPYSTNTAASQQYAAPFPMGNDTQFSGHTQSSAVPSFLGDFARPANVQATAYNTSNQNTSNQNTSNQSLAGAGWRADYDPLDLDGNHFPQMTPVNLNRFRTSTELAKANATFILEENAKLTTEVKELRSRVEELETNARSQQTKLEEFMQEFRAFKSAVRSDHFAVQAVIDLNRLEVSHSHRVNMTDDYGNFVGYRPARIAPGSTENSKGTNQPPDSTAGLSKPLVDLTKGDE